jgi:O-antigen/teichoic acid export membrane protein
LDKKPADSILSRFISGTLAIGIGRLSTVVLGFLGLAIATRWVSLEDMGVFTLLRLIGSFMASMSDFGISLSLTRFLASSENAQDKRKLTNTALFFRCLTIAVAFITALLGREALFLLFGRIQYSELFIYVPIILAVEGLCGITYAILEGSFKFKSLSVIEFIASVLNLTLTIVFVVWMKLGVLGLIYMRIVFRGLSAIFAYFAARIRPRVEFDLRKLVMMLKFGFPIYINSILSFIFSRADTFLIGALLGSAEIALYEIARKIPESLEMMADAFRQVYFPFISKLFSSGEIPKGTRMLNHSIRLVTFLGMFGTLISIIFGKEIITFVFSEKYLASAPIFGILMILLTFTIIHMISGYSLVAVGGAKKIPIIESIHTMISFSGYLILIPILNLAGAALANLGGTIMVFPLYVFFLYRSGIEVKFRFVLKPILIFGLFWVFIEALNPQCLRPKIALIGLFIIANLLMAVINQEDIAILIREGKTILARMLNRSRPNSINTK